MIEFDGHQTPDAPHSDEQRFTKLFGTHHSQVLAYCRRRLPEHLVDDAVAETFTAAWRTLSRAPEDEKLWLLGLARGSVANQRRRRDRFDRLGTRVAMLDRPSPERDHADTTGWQGPFLTAFASLSEGDQEVLRLCTWERLGPTESAAVLGCSTAAVKVRLHRARQRLRKALTRAESATAPCAIRTSPVDRLAITNVQPLRKKESP